MAGDGMEVLVTAVVGDLVSRSVSFFADKLYRQKMSRGEDLQCLQRLLQRIETIVMEAEGRHITNQAMLRQLQMLREGMFKGYYLVDAIKHRINDEVGDHHSFSFRKPRPMKRLCFSTSTFTMAFQRENKAEVGKMLGSLQSIFDDMKEFVVFLKGYPHIYRQPYSQHLVLDRCIFGRQVEIERIINFLLQEPLGAESLAVLPIIGPARVGKSTLVEHVCYNERVRSFFSSIVFCTGNNIGSKNFSDLSHSGVVKHRSCVADERSLIIIEFLEDDYLEEEKWRRLYTSRSCLPRGSKIIITSRSERFMEIGTTQPLVLTFLPHEAFWYFFKVIAFGSTNPDEHPFLVSAAMEIGAFLDGCFVGANFFASLFRANLCTQFWRVFLINHRDMFEKHVVLFGEHPHALLQKNHNIYIRRNIRDKPFLVSVYKTCPKNDVPRVMLHDVLSGNAKTHGKFDTLVWRSRIPPYHEYVLSCEAQAQQHMALKRKRS